METEDITGRVVSATDSTENDVSPVVGVRPVDHIVLPVNPDIEAGKHHGWKIALPLSRKTNALPMNKINLPVQSGHGDPLHTLSDRLAISDPASLLSNLPVNQCQPLLKLTGKGFENEVLLSQLNLCYC
jgi:hypothetical protein